MNIKLLLNTGLCVVDLSTCVTLPIRIVFGEDDIERLQVMLEVRSLNSLDKSVIKEGNVLQFFRVLKDEQSLVFKCAEDLIFEGTLRYVEQGEKDSFTDILCVEAIKRMRFLPKELIKNKI